VPGIPAIVIPELPHHITQRGNNRQDTFFSPDDYNLYISLLADQSSRCRLKITGYCLMSNHIHIIALKILQNMIRDCPSYEAALHPGLNRLRASNTKGNTFTEWIEIEK
jgi:hypothetical protein